MMLTVTSVEQKWSPGEAAPRAQPALAHKNINVGVTHRPMFMKWDNSVGENKDG